LNTFHLGGFGCQGGFKFQPMRYLLTVGINKYLRSAFGGQNIDLKQCVNDATRTHTALSPFCDMVQLLDDENATRAEIIACLKYYAGQCKAGDTFIYHQSSHGTMWYNADGSVTNARVVHDGILADHQIAPILASFVKGVTVITLSDLCHSESSQRSPFSPAEYARARSMEYRGNVPPKPTELNLNYAATIYHLSACQFDQVAWETAQGGVFTTLFLNVLKQTKGERSIKTIFKTVARNIRNQTPAIEIINPSRKAPKL
jgi:hypothetical protein